MYQRRELKEQTKKNIFFCLGFLSRTFTNHRTVGEGGGHFFNSSLPLPPAARTLRHQLGDCGRELTSAHSQPPDSNREPLVICLVIMFVLGAMVIKMSKNANFLYFLQRAQLDALQSYALLISIEFSFHFGFFDILAALSISCVFPSGISGR